MINEMVPKTLQEAILHFADETRSHDFLARLRWPHGPVCPRCGSNHVSFLEKQRRFQCSSKHPKRQFTVKTGTIFEDSPLPLSKWLPAIWLIASAKNGVSSYELGRALNITQKTAWFMLHRIRFAMQEGDGKLFSGAVEVDETYIGGKSRFMHRAKRERTIKGTGGMGKVAVMGLLERHGLDGYSIVKTKIVPNVRRFSVSSTIRQHVEQGSAVYTDALKSYDDLDSEYVHEVIDHAEAYMHGQVHTNGIENFWSLLKRAIRGTYVSVEPFHLFRYLDEEAFRFNTRKGGDATRFETIVGSIQDKRLTWKQLTGTIGMS